LYINSTVNNIIFDNYDDNTERSVLILPSLKCFVNYGQYKVLTKNETLIDINEIKAKLLLDTNKIKAELLSGNYGFESHVLESLSEAKVIKAKLLLDSYDLESSLHKIMYNLESGNYKFDFYIYYEDLSNVNNEIHELYTYDLLNKNVLNKLWGSYGYIVVTTFMTHLVGSKGSTTRLDFFATVCRELTISLVAMNEDVKFKSTMKLNKDTILVISKPTKEESLE
jgi:hypothetical protein